MGADDGIIIPFIPDASKLDAALLSTIEQLEQTGQLSAEVSAQFKQAMQIASQSTQQTTAQVENLNTSFKDMSKNIAGGAFREAQAGLKSYGTEIDNTVKKHVSLRTQIRQLINDLGEMRLAGKEGTQQFRDMQAQVAILDREMLISRGQVKNLAEEFRGLRVAAEAIHGVNAAMQIGVGTMSVFGTENEHVEKTMRSLMGVMLIANGVQEAANLLKATSTVRMVAEETATNALTAATWLFAEASAAAWAATLGAITLVAAAIGGLIFVYEKFIGQNATLLKMQQQFLDFSKAHYDAAKARQEIEKDNGERAVKDAEQNLANLKAQKASTDDLRKAEAQLAQARVDAATQNLSVITEAVDKFKQSPKDAEEAQKKMIAQMEELERQKEKLLKTTINPFATGAKFDESMKKQKEALETLNAQIKTIKDALQEYSTAINNQVNESLEAEREIEKELLELDRDRFKLKVANALQGSKIELDAKKSELEAEKKLQLQAIDDESGDEQDKATRKEIIQAEFRKKELELDRNFYVAGLENAKANFDAENLLVRKGTEAELNVKIESLAKQAQIDQAKIKDSATAADEIKRINEKLIADVTKLNKDFDDAQRQQDLRGDVVVAEAKAELIAKGTKQELQAQKDIYVAENKLQIDNINTTITNEKLKSAEILKANNDLIKKLQDADQSFLTEQIKTQTKYQDTIIALANAQKQNVDNTPGAIDKDKLNAQLNVLEKQKNALEQQVAHAADQYQLDLKNAGDNADKKGDITNQYNKQSELFGQQYRNLQQQQSDAIIKYQVKQAQDALKVFKDFSQQIADSIFQIQKERIDKGYELRIDKLEKEKDFELNNANISSAQRIAIQKKYDKEIAAQKLAQWKADQQAKEEQAAINGALAIVNILATMPWTTFGVTQAVAIAASVAATAAQIAVISSQKPPAFAKGTPVGTPDTPYGMKLVGEQGPELIYTPGGERIIPADATARILAQYQVPTMLGIDANAFAAQNSTSTDINYDKLGRTVAEALKANPQTLINMDKSGLTTYLIQRGNKHQMLNNKFKG